GQKLNGTRELNDDWTMKDLKECSLQNADEREVILGRSTSCRHRVLVASQQQAIHLINGLTRRSPFVGVGPLPCSARKGYFRWSCLRGHENEPRGPERQNSQPQDRRAKCQQPAE